MNWLRNWIVPLGIKLAILLALIEKIDKLMLVF